MSWRPKRFDVAGAHPDEAWRAVSDIRESVEDIRKQFVGGPEIGAVNTMIYPWGEIFSRPMRFGNTPDAEVQRYLARGVELVDALKQKMPLGLSRRQQQVRDRCAELSKSMQKVLDRRPDEESPRPAFRRKPRMRM
jgi:hypothetical protein